VYEIETIDEFDAWLGGISDGDKSTQQADIKQARKLAKEL
jgi:hypothetical protein